jgi:pimeloyl-ACP methyl ester carboxylesterase
MSLLRRAASVRTLAVAALLLARGVAAQPKAPPDSWTDPVRHKSGFVNVTSTVRLHYLDFGGTGPTVLFLAGLGNTAHAFDDFAPALTDRFHVVALTRRGFGQSTHPPGGYDTPRLVEDIRAAIQRLHLGRVILIGHSIAGEEMTYLAAKHPDEVAKLVYLDAAYDRIAADSMISEVFVVPPNIPSRPDPTDADTATAAAYVDFVHRTRGVNIPESDIRERYKYDGWNEEITTAYQSIGAIHPNYRDVRAPALAIYAVTDTVTQLEPWQRADREHVAGLMELIRGTEFVEKKLRDQFKREVAHGGVVEIHGGHHWIFVSHRDEVLADVRRFLALP